jgi:hypothetical protein
MPIRLARTNEQQTLRSLFLGITIWLVHLLLLEALVSVSCKWGWLTSPVAGLSGLQFVEAVINLITVLAMLFLIYLPWKDWRNYQSHKPIHNPQLLEDTEEDRRGILAFIAMAINGFLFLYTVATFAPIFALRACGQA